MLPGFLMFCALYFEEEELEYFPADFQVHPFSPESHWSLSDDWDRE